MNNFITLFIAGIAAFVVLKWLLGGLIDNRGDINIEQERRLTEDQ